MELHKHWKARFLQDLELRRMELQRRLQPKWLLQQPVENRNPIRTQTLRTGTTLELSRKADHFHCSKNPLRNFMQINVQKNTHNFQHFFQRFFPLSRYCNEVGELNDDSHLPAELLYRQIEYLRRASKSFGVKTKADHGGWLGEDSMS